MRGISAILVTFLTQAFAGIAFADGLHEFGPWGHAPREATGTHRFSANDVFPHTGIPKRGTAVYRGAFDLANPSNSGVVANVTGFSQPLYGNDVITLDFGHHKATSDINVPLFTPGSTLHLSGSGRLFAGNSKYVNDLTGQFFLIGNSADLAGKLHGSVGPGALSTAGNFSASGTEVFFGGAEPPRPFTVQGTFKGSRQ